MIPKPRRNAVSLFFSADIGEIINNTHDRMIFSAAIAFAFNLLYALYHCVLGILNLSLWFIAMCAFYGILATMRFSAILCGRKNHYERFLDTEYFVMKLSGILLILLSFVLASVIYISLSQNIATKYEKIIMITIATCTFCKITMAVVKAIKQHNNSSPLLAVIRNISYVEAAASILTLQRSMLVSFGSMETKHMQAMNSIAGAFVCLFVVILGISMAKKGIAKGK